MFFLLGTSLVCVLGSLFHFSYEISGENFLVGLFTSVNESTWEHMKLLFFPMLLYALIGNRFMKEEFPSIGEAMARGILVGTCAIPVLFYTYSGILGYNLPTLDIGTFIISVVFGFYYAYRTRNKKAIGFEKVILYGLVLLFAIAFPLFTLYPPKLGIFISPV